MVNALIIKNFKSLQDSGEIEIKPIMLLIGPNSSGKTSFIQFLLTLKQTLESRTKENPILINGRYVELGTFNDLIFGHDETKNLDICFNIPTTDISRKIENILERNDRFFKEGTFDLMLNLLRESGQKSLLDFLKIDDSKTVGELSQIFYKYLEEDFEKNINVIFEKVSELSQTKESEETKDRMKELKRRAKKISEIPKIRMELKNIDFSLLKLNVKVSYNKSEKRMFLSEYTILDKNNKILLQIENDEVTSFINDKKTKFTGLNKSNFFFDFSTQEKSYRFSSFDFVRQILDLINGIVVKNINEFSNNLYYLGPLREYPKRYYLASGEVSPDVGFKGEFFVDVLYRTKLEKQKNILNSLNIWMKKFNMAYEIKPEEITENIYALVVVDPISKIPVTITDVGFGVSQVLPILVEGFNLKSGSTLIVEQPEIHLHPKVQAELGDVLIEFYKQGIFSIIETHSEHLILRIQRRIAEGMIENSDVGIYYFEPTKDGTKIIKLEIDKMGMIQNWPKGFFEEDFVESFKHLEAIANQGFS